MLTTIYGLSGALIFGSADFLGGLASKRISAVLSTAIAALTGLVVLLVLLPFLGGDWNAADLIWGALSGVAGALAISLLYACLAIGPMSILSPLTAVVGAIVPMVWGLVGGDRLGPLGYWALGLALVAVVLVGFVPERGAARPGARGLLMAIGSGIFIGCFLILMDQTSAQSGLIPLAANRATSGTIMLLALGVLALVRARRRTTADVLAPGAEPGGSRATFRTGVLLALACGVVDVIGNSLLLVGIRLGDLSVMSVLTAMYPAGTILLAALVLRERIAPVQWVGLALALTAAGMLALA